MKRQTTVFSTLPRHCPMPSCPRRRPNTSWSLYVCFPGILLLPLPLPHLPPKMLRCSCVPLTLTSLLQVDSKGEVSQFLSKHSRTMMDKLNTQRLNNQFCDITLLIEGEEFRAHKAVLAACSEYFHELFLEKGAASTHEAVVDLFGERH